LRKRLSGLFIAVVLIAALAFLAIDVGFSLYRNDRFGMALPVCTLDVLSGDTKVLTPDTLMWEEAEDGMVLEPGSRIKTNENSYASLTFSEGTTTTIEPDTDLIIDQLGNGDSTEADSILLKQRSGKTWNRVTKRSADDDSFQIQTASASVVVYGTIFSTEIDEAGTTLVQTAEGLVNVTAQGQAVLVAEGHQTVVCSGTPPAFPTPTPAAVNELVFTVDAAVAGRIVSPGGSSTGFLPDGSTVNQIPGSRTYKLDSSRQMIRIAEPGEGEYSVVLSGDVGTTGSYSLEGFSEGERTFVQSASGNITDKEGLVLRLHLEVIDGLVKGATALAHGDPEENTTTTGTDNGNTPVQLSGEDSEELSWYHSLSAYTSNSWIVVVSIVSLFALIFILVWRRT
jgi:hypothetical protein